MRKVSVLAPCYNEHAYIHSFVHALQSQNLEGIDCEFIIIDGGSNDGTREELEQLMKQDPRIRLAENPERFVSNAMNLGIKIAKGDIIIRMDIHTLYDSNYVHECVSVLHETQAQNVGGAWCGIGISTLHKAIARTFKSRFASGGALSRQTLYTGPVDTVYLGCWPKEIFQNIGDFDVDLIRDEDEEHNIRIAAAGKKIWQSSRIKSQYFVRSSFPAVFNQFLQYGYWKVLVMKKHHKIVKLRHLVPVSALLVMLMLLLIAPFLPAAVMILSSLILLYISICISAGIKAAIEERTLAFLVLCPMVFPFIHAGYGLGMIIGMIDFIFLNKKGRETFKILTR